MTKKPCDQCPWRLANQGKRSPGGFYTKKNAKRLWGQIRRGGAKQSCHLTDPSHPDHIAAGCAENATAQECPGSVILVMREFRLLADAGRNITPASIDRYKATRKGGLTKSGLHYWVVSRLGFGDAPIVGGGVLPEVDVDDPEVGLPESLK